MPPAPALISTKQLLLSTSSENKHSILNFFANLLKFFSSHSINFKTCWSLSNKARLANSKLYSKSSLNLSNDFNFVSKLFFILRDFSISFEKMFKDFSSSDLLLNSLIFLITFSWSK